MLRADGSYPFDGDKWEMVLCVDQETAERLADGKVCNKEFVLIPRWDGDFQYLDWRISGQQGIDRKYFPGALAVYKHDFKWWLIRCKAA
jgi:hypothetical protein